jgi:2-hydroxy-3-oxopropionate reductase
MEMTLTSQKIGFIGLGTMGAPMAQHLVKAGHELFVHTRGRMPDAIGNSTATRCDTARGVAQRADTIFIMVPDTADVDAVLFPPLRPRYLPGR